MVRFFNKNLKSHYYEGGEDILELMDLQDTIQLSNLLSSHVNNFSNWSTDDFLHLFQKLTIPLGIKNLGEFIQVLCKRGAKIKDLFLAIDLILESFSVTLNSKDSYYFNDFVDDLNDFFLINEIPLQIRCLLDKKEFYVEKVISPEISEKIKETLQNFSEEKKVFTDFKDSIKKFSSGDWEGSIEKCCISIEDYLCIILDKQTCSSVDSYYREVSKKFAIPQELDNRFSNLISYIHKYRSVPNHGAIEKKEIPEPELTNEIVIQFTMAILNYLKKKNDRMEKSKN